MTDLSVQPMTQYFGTSTGIRIKSNTYDFVIKVLWDILKFVATKGPLIKIPILCFWTLLCKIAGHPLHVTRGII